MPFPRRHRYRLAGVLAPLFLISLVLSSYLFLKVITFVIGFSFFGDPIIQHVLGKLNRGSPQWYKWLELRKYVSLHELFVPHKGILTRLATFCEACLPMLK